ncbi:MAG: DUF5050 domain-containing protein [Candidatus Faecousia sp.]|nr:DUF5050 domain-containing protein [Clostridiales bacterium]MDY6180300.1 DUF5050 domain-containing protein [Candidatus Faecousia sp.]
MRGYNCRRSILAVFLALILVMSCAACGSPDEAAQTKNNANPLTGYWVCTGLDMGDGEMMDTEAIRSLMGLDGAEVMALCIDGGKGELYLMGDILSCDWTKTPTGGYLTSPEYDGVVAEFTAEADGTLKCVVEGENAGMTFLLSRVDVRPEVFDRPAGAEAEGVSLPGFWVCTGLGMGDGEVMDADAIQATFQTGADFVISLRLREDGRAYVLYFGECMGGTWEETDTGFDVHIGGEDGETLSFYDWGDGTADLSVEDENAAFDFTLSKSETAPQAFESAPLALLDVRFTPEQAMDMSNFMVLGRYAILDGKLYGYCSKSSTDRRLVCYDYDPALPKESRLTGYKQLDEGGAPCYIQTANGYLYYICWNVNGNTLRRIGMDGSDKTVLYDKDCDYLQICGDTMYFTDENHRLVSADLDGQNITTLIDKEVYYSYCLGDGWFLYQDDADGESLHITNVRLGYDQRLSEDKVFGCVLEGAYLYYVDVHDYENGTGSLTRLNLDTLETEVSETVMHGTVLIAGGRIWSQSYGISEETENWMRLEDGSWDGLGYTVVYIDEDTRICWYIIEREKISQYVIYAGDTFTTF